MKTLFRYPGNKEKRSISIAESLPNDITKYYEPMVGGGSVLLKVATLRPHVELYASDINPNVMDYWSVISNGRVNKLINEIWKHRTITVSDWNRIFASPPSAFRFVFLNKTSYNGFIHENTGPIGGQSQDGGRQEHTKGKWKVDFAWKPEKLIDQIKQQHELLRGRITTASCSLYASPFWNILQG